MRYLPLFFLPLTLAAQAADSDRSITQTLISEIQQLRASIERSTLLNARTQLAISQLQMQETSVARLSQQLSDSRSSSRAHQVERMTERIKEREQARTDPEYAAPQRHAVLEDEIRAMKENLDELQTAETQRLAREGELASQLQAAQNQIADTRARVAEMERALDAAIQQLLKRP